MATFHCITEHNAWEGETWHHYFLDGPGVLDALQSVYSRTGDFVQLDTDEYTDEETTRLTNLDNSGYMQKHWFGELTDPEGLASATEQQLYKGGIRDFGEELFE